MFAIICTARSGHSKGVHTLALVDRKKCRRLWWTSDNKAIIEVFNDRKAAVERAAKLAQNNPRVVELRSAAHLIDCQKRNIRADIERREAEQDYKDSMSSAEMGWDGHKVW